jgi:hypothetical protein
MILRFDEKDAEKILKQMSYDISLVSKFSLMDYSLLFVVAFNPNYVEKYIDDFETEIKDGKKVPVFPIQELKEKEIPRHL